MNLFLTWAWAACGPVSNVRAKRKENLATFQSFRQGSFVKQPSPVKKSLNVKSAWREKEKRLNLASVNSSL